MQQCSASSRVPVNHQTDCWRLGHPIAFSSQIWGPSPVFRNRFGRQVVSHPRSESPCAVANRFIRTPALPCVGRECHLPAAEDFGIGIGNDFCFLADPAVAESTHDWFQAHLARHGWLVARLQSRPPRPLADGLRPGSELVLSFVCSA